MFVKNEVEGFNWLMSNCWSGAIDTLNRIKEAEKEEEFMDFLEINFEFCEMPTMTELNDFIWFEDEYIFEALGIEEENDDEEEEEREDE